MRAHAKGQNQNPESVVSAGSNKTASTPRHLEAVPFRRALDHRLTRAREQARTVEDGLEWNGTTSRRYGHDFQRIQLLPEAARAVQAKVAADQPGDKYEREADQIVEQLMRMPQSQVGPIRIGDPGGPKPQPEGPSNEHLPTGQAGGVKSNGMSLHPNVDEVLRAPGQQLDQSTRAFMECGLGHDFAQVRVHVDREAAQSARGLSALAYTVGRNIVFDHGQYAPNTMSGKRLLTHELVHVIQQGAAQPRGQLVASSRLHAEFINSTPPGLTAVRSVRSFGLQRKPDPNKRTFTPTKFIDAQTLIKAVAVDNPKQEDLAGACRFLDSLPMAATLLLARQIATRKLAAAATLHFTALQGWGTSRLRVALSAVLFKGQISRVGFAAEQASDLQVLDATAARQVLDVLGPAIPEVEAMQKSKGFQALRPDEQARLSYLIGGSTSLSKPAPAAMRALLSDPHLNKDDPATFRKFITDEKYLQWGIGLPHGILRPRDPFRIGLATDVPGYKFGGLGVLTAAAVRRDVMIDGKDASGKSITQTIPVFVPKTDRPKDKRYRIATIDEVAQMLAATPDISRSKIVKVDVHWMPYTGGVGKPDDARATNAAAGADGVVNLYPVNTELFGVTGTIDVIHETGHTASIAAWGADTDDDKWKPWRSAMQSDGMAVSQYAKETIFEDFAESWALYVPVIGTPRETEVRALIPARCKLIDTLLWQKPTGKRP